MNTTARNLAIAGGALDVAASIFFATLVKDVAVDHAPLTSTSTLLAIGLATLAVMGACLILAAVIIGVVEAVIERHMLSYAEGVLEGVREGIEATVGPLAAALSHTPRNVHPMHPQPGHRFRP